MPDHFAKPDDELFTAQKQRCLHRSFQGYTARPHFDTVAFGLTAIADDLRRRTVVDELTMRALVQHEYGPPERLRVEDVAVPSVGPGEVRLKLEAASINSWDWDWVVGKPLTRIFSPLGPKYPILGCDVAGTVEAVGEGVSDWEVGDEVFGDVSGSRWGGFAELGCAPAEILARKPPTLSFERAAALPQAGVLALQSLRWRGQEVEGAAVLLNGAGGGVGTIAVQLAKAAGATVTCVDRGDKLDRLHRLGADAVIDYTTDDLFARPERYDLVVDVVGSLPMRAWRHVLSPSGRYAMVGGSIPRILETLTLGALLGRGGQKLGIVVHVPNREDLDDLAARTAAGTLDPIIDRVVPLDDVPGALRDLGEGRVFGKVVVRPGAKG